MQVVRIADSTHALAAPSNWDEDKSGRCQTLHARLEEVDGVMFMRSAWEADASEIGWMLAGSRIVLGVTPIKTETGISHPVVHMGILPPPEDSAPAFTIRQFTNLKGVTICRAELFCRAGSAYAEIEMHGATIVEAAAAALHKVDELAREGGLI